MVLDTNQSEPPPRRSLFGRLLARVGRRRDSGPSGIFSSAGAVDPGPGADPADRRAYLLDLIRQVRRRWRTKLLVRGAAIALAAGVAALVLSASALEYLSFSPGAVLAFRLVFSLIVAALVGLFLVRPWLRRASDEQVALYLEEHNPLLDATVVSAVEASRPAVSADGSRPSPSLVRRLIESAIERCEAAEAARRLEQPQIRRSAAAVVIVAVAAIAAFVMGPAWLRHGASALLLLSESLQAASPYQIEVQPGDATIPRGADQTITARLQGFDAETVELVVRKDAGGSFEQLPFVRSESGAFEAMLFDLAGPTDYFVQASGVRSPLFTLRVIDLPYVQQLTLEYHFPAYTGRATETVENGGDVVVPKGTEIRLRAVSTIPSPAGRVLLHQSTEVPLTREADGTFTGSFTADQTGFYRIELEGPQGERVTASPQYTIDVLDDRVPMVQFEKPGRDLRVSPVEEVFVRARATDDHGVRELRLVYAVNGGEEKTLRLFGGAAAQGDVTAGHTFYMEELGLEPGDFVSYFARAVDNDTIAGPKTATSDLFFLQIRPFGREFRPALSQGGAGGGGAAGAQVGALSEQQRQIISATFNVVRDRRTLSAAKLRENVVLLALMQARLREQVEGLVTRLTSRLVDVEGPFQKIGEILPNAVAEMRAAEAKLQAQKPDEALAPEQRALTHLQKAEELYELEVSFSQNGGGGGGGANSALAEDLADLFELELDKLANQYETLQRAGQQGANQQMDELLERLKELARRQEQEAERQRRRAAAGQSAQGGGASQRALAEQAEEAARRLERLSREQNRPDLAEAARRMQEAADAMRQAAGGGSQNGGAQAGAALERLREAERQLERDRSSRGDGEVRDALQRAEELVRQQEEIADEVSGLPAEGPSRDERVSRLGERKSALEGEVADLERRLDQTSGELWRDQRESARKLQEAAGSIRDNKIKEKIRYSQGVLQGLAPEYARSFEEEIGKNLGDVRDRLAEAVSALGRSPDNARESALERARRLAQGVESLDERMRNQAGRGRQQPGESGQPSPGQQGSEGQQGGEGQQSAQGGQSGAQGQQSGATDGQAGDGDTEGAWGRSGGYGSRRPGATAFTGEQIRQFRGEIRQWSSEAQDLRRELGEQGIEAGDLDEILRALRQLDSDRVYRDAAELERLQTFVTEGLKRFEYSLRRALESEGQDLFLAGSDEVPPGFRPLVEEYYRSLAGRRQR